jgi:hypothetical protein
MWCLGLQNMGLEAPQEVLANTWQHMPQRRNVLALHNHCIQVQLAYAASVFAGSLISLCFSSKHKPYRFECFFPQVHVQVITTAPSLVGEEVLVHAGAAAET